MVEADVESVEAWLDELAMPGTRGRPAPVATFAMAGDGAT